MDATRYFVGVAARDAVDAAVAGGYVEVNHGKAGPLERMHDGDALVYYSPRTGERGAALQAFTAIARIVGDVLYQAGAAGDTLRPFRRGAIYASVQPAPIKPLVDSLDFIRAKLHWGTALRYGFVQISSADFQRISCAMECDAHPPFALASPASVLPAAVAAGG